MTLLAAQPGLAARIVALGIALGDAASAHELRKLTNLEYLALRGKVLKTVDVRDADAICRLPKLAALDVLDGEHPSDGFDVVEDCPFSLHEYTGWAIANPLGPCSLEHQVVSPACRRAPAARSPGTCSLEHLTVEKLDAAQRAALLAACPALTDIETARE